MSMRLFVFNLPRLCLSPRRSSLSSFPFPFPSPPSQRISQEEGERRENKALQATVCVCLIQRHRFVRSFHFLPISPHCAREERALKQRRRRQQLQPQQQPAKVPHQVCVFLLDEGNRDLYHGKLCTSATAAGEEGEGEGSGPDAPFHLAKCRFLRHSFQLSLSLSSGTVLSLCCCCNHNNSNGSRSIKAIPDRGEDRGHF